MTTPQEVQPARWPARPRLGAAFYKAHGLGNDYLVFEEGDAWTATADAVRLVCDPHHGVGSDGLVGLLGDRSGDVFRLRMFNPDGGEFERSGNGLRVLGSHLARSGYASPFLVSVGGDDVVLRRHGAGTDPYDLSVDMGRARGGPDAVGRDPTARVEGGTIDGPGRARLGVVPVSVGNPHLVVPTDELTDAALSSIGAHLVGHPALAHGANVQLARPAGPGRCEIRIWERGVGPTSASGTSACAVATAMVWTGTLEAGPITVVAPGGEMVVTVGEDLDIVLRGPVEEVCAGTLTDGLLARLGRGG
jgi:diaminopimelate epimerase